MSQEVSQENLPSDSSREVLKVTLLGGGWNSSAGGLATFNRELAIHLSQRPKVEVSFLVPDGHCTEEDKREAGSYGITVVGAKKCTGYDPLDWLIAPPESHQMDVVVGHGAKLGKQVQFIKKNARFHNCKWVQVVHTSPEDLSKHKEYPDPNSKGEEKHKVEVDLCKSADLVVPVGPRLEEAYSSYLQRCKTHQDVFTVIPGLFDREFGGLEQSPNENAEFKVLLCGRGDKEDFKLKGYDIAVKAFADHRLKGKRYHLIFVGAPKGEQDEVRKRLLQFGIADDQLTVREFIESREEMKDLLCEVDLVIMPSRSEGYGLVPLEALSAGLPILVSSKSGFARALEPVPVGDSCIVHSDDPAKWAEAIEGVRVRHRVRLAEIKFLQTSYNECYSWKEQCKNLAEKLWTMVNDEKLSQMSNEVNHMKEKLDSLFQNTGTEIKGQVEIRMHLDCEIVPAPQPKKPQSPQPQAKIRKVVKTSQAPQLLSQSPTTSQSESCSQPQQNDGLTTSDRLVQTQRDVISTQAVLNRIADCYIDTMPPTHDAMSEFLVYMERIRNVLVVNKGTGSLILTLQCSLLQILDELWEDYRSGHLNEVVQKLLVTDEVLQEFGLLEVKMTTTILEEEYLACRKYFLHIQDVSQKLDQMRTSIETVKKESKVQVDISAKLEQMRREIESVREEVDICFRTTTEEIRGEGLKGTENRDSSFIGRPLKNVKGKSHPLKRTVSEAFGSASTGSIVMDIQQNVHPAVKCKKIDDVEATGGQSTSSDRKQLQAAIRSMKANIKTETEQSTDVQQPFRLNPGEGRKPKDLKIDQIYVNVVIHEGRVKYDFPTDRWEQLKVYPQPNTKTSTSVRPQDVIDDKYKNILVVGRPGIGKTMMSTKLLRTWASDNAKMQKQFQVAFLLKFKHLNNETDLSLHELLARSETVESLDGEIWKFVIENPTKVLLIFDGIDEFLARSYISKDDSRYKNGVDKKMPLHALYRKLASGKLIRGATVITTTRPAAAECLNNLTFDRTVEILGFTSEQVKEYVENFTKDDQTDDAKTTIWEHISTNINFFSLCYIPVNCFIICHCLLQIINICTDTARNLPSKITDIYSMYVKIFFFKHNRNDKYSRSTTDLGTYIYKKFDDLQPENDSVFKKLGEVAFNGIKEGRLVFESSEVGDLQDCGLLHRLPDVKSRKLSEPPKPQFCFTHLTVQEFFAAKHLTDTMNKDDLQRFVASHIHHGAWQVVMQFVAGLLEPDADQGMSNIDFFADLLPTSTKEQDTLIMWPANDQDKRLALNVCKCLNEVDFEQQNSLQHKTAKIGFNALDFSSCSLGPVDCIAITHFIKNSNLAAECLNLSFNDLGSLSCREICDLVKDHDVNCNLTTLDLRYNNIGEQGAAYLCDALKDVNCDLETLDLENNKIGDQAAAHLCDAIKDVNCDLERLNLSFNNIGDQGAAHLCDALKDVNCDLKTLNLSGNKIGEQGAAHLCVALKDVNCGLETLYLSRNKIGEQGAAHLCDAIKDVNCDLEILDLSSNKIREQGAAHLRDALKDVNCKLFSLDLRVNKIGDQGAAHLSDALKDVNCKLKTLNLVSNKIGEQGAAHLCDALKDVNCKLTILNLSINKIGEQGAAYLSDALKDVNCNLSTLDLSNNKIGEQGAAHLCDALKDVNCNLSTLDLSYNKIGEQGAAHLCDALKDVNCNLTTLDLSGNNIGEQGAAYLCDALKDENYKLTTLDLSDNNIGQQVQAQLSDSLSDVNCTVGW